ncbi:DNA polymerase III subunit beta [Fundicoccus ignavus]|uniref:Beta sliding clamp n=1 Tax=Fundicoccus ignavus TaxID=2664442 RepID=A0A6I2GDW8_9LACT|nr:DNA polymerase III subunit beta [Fundicoccus ignavus]MRI81736.1 DNA polymerase III subunit beta [Fundicoccus ignavus]MRI86030.1 DNA polymerase III subunit beta [Fundicoccus ignavus]MRJ47955.1 DNA polymerase III subunit beta [Fundicoccus ignavus]
MKFTINRNALTTQLANVSRAIPSKATIQILTGLKLSVSNEGITLIGSDSDISIESFLPIDDETLNLNIEETGHVVLPARLFNEIVKKLPLENVTIEMNENFSVTVTSGKAMFNIVGIDGDAYPHLPEIEADKRITLPTASFKQMINQTIFAASNQESRPVLTGIHLQATSNYLTAIATDSHRLSKREIPVDINETQLNFDAITIPKKTMTELTRIIEDDQTLFMIVAQQQVIFIADNLTIYSRLLEGNYPETSRLIPTSHQTEMVVNANEFHQAIDRAALMSHEGKNNVVQLTVDNAVVELSVSGNEAGHVAEIINTKTAGGDDLKISFNPDYMKDALKSFGDIAVKVEFQSAVRPLLISAETESEIPHNQLLQLLTPVRTH